MNEDIISKLDEILELLKNKPGETGPNYEEILRKFRDNDKTNAPWQPPQGFYRCRCGQWVGQMQYHVCGNGPSWTTWC